MDETSKTPQDTPPKFYTQEQAAQMADLLKRLHEWGSGTGGWDGPPWRELARFISPVTPLSETEITMMVIDALAILDTGDDRKHGDAMWMLDGESAVFTANATGQRFRISVGEIKDGSR